MALDYVEGVSLPKVADEEELPVEAIFLIMAQVVSALLYLRETEYDLLALRPRHLFLDATGTVKILAVASLSRGLAARISSATNEVTSDANYPPHREREMAWLVDILRSACVGSKATDRTLDAQLVKRVIRSTCDQGFDELAEKAGRICAKLLRVQDGDEYESVAVLCSEIIAWLHQRRDAATTTS
jgi:hypothetical protein